MTRFADGPTVEVIAHINAPASVVWSYIADINLSARFQDEFVEAEWLDAGPALDARFLGRNVSGSRSWETTSTVVGFEPNRLFAWAVDDVDNPGATWTFRIEENGTNTVLIYHRVVGPGPSGLTAAIEKYPEREEEFIDNRDAQHRKHMQAVVDGVKELAEA
ncbi:MAG: SRPBCC family protein [Acidimicrobiia bacterium]